MPSKRKTAAQAAKKARRQSRMDRPSGESRYGRKKKYLIANGGFGFQYGNPDGTEKPWK